MTSTKGGDAAARPATRPFAGILAAARGSRDQVGLRGALGALVMGRALPGAKDLSPKAAGPGAPRLGGDDRSRDAPADPVDAEKAARDTADGDADEGSGKGHAPSRDDADDLDRLDPSARHAAHLAAPGGIEPMTSAMDAASAAGDAPVRARSLEELLPLLVRRIAWAGDRHKGTVRLELGAGAYAGTTVVVHADGGRVRVEIGGNEGPELDRLRGRLDARLRGHGLDVESVT